MIRTTRSLADGREILYFDTDAHPQEHTARDTRDLPPVSTRLQLLYDAFVEVYLDVLGRFAPPMPYIASWNQAPVHAGLDEWWLHLQLFSCPRAPGKLKYLAGSESGMGAFITDTNPEDVAETLRAVGVS